MKNKNVFLAFPFSQFCEDDSDDLSQESKSFFESLTTLMKENNITYYSAHERENWGQDYFDAKVSTQYDYDAINDCDVVISNPGVPYSGGVHIELGWASSLKKDIILLLKKDHEYSPLVTGISTLTNVKIYYYIDFFKDSLQIIENIINGDDNE